MAKGLFTSTEEIKFQYVYIQGNVEKAYDPNTRRNPTETKCFVCSKKQNKCVQKIYQGHTR